MSIVVTGGAGFIGSCIVRTLNDNGIKDIIIVDDIGSTDKWLNMRNKKYLTYVHKSQFLERLQHYENIEAIIHMGAQSATTEKNFDYLWQNNFEYTKTLWNYCANKQISFIYASSAATYGNGSLGFSNQMDIDRLLPLNGYGYSKQLFDLWVKHQASSRPAQHVGLKFFNVYGPNEYFKGSMASMVYHGFKQIKETGKIKLFKSCNPDYEDGEQLRDFVYVKDVCALIWWLLNNERVCGLCNVGTGNARSFKELAEWTFAALGKHADIEYIDMPEHLQEKYQYFTQADMQWLQKVNCPVKFRSIEEGVKDYVQEHLDRDFKVY